MLQALITGGTGFVGRALSRRLLAEGWGVTVLHRRGSSPSTVAALEDEGIFTAPYASHFDVHKIMAELAPDAVFHLAARQSRDHDSGEIDDFIAANISLGTHVLEGAGSGCVVVNAMSYSQFRHGRPEPHSLYTATKQAFLEISRFYRVKRMVDTRNVVLFDNYGPDDSRDKLIPYLIESSLSGSVARIGPLEQRYNVIHVNDLAAGLIAAAMPGNPPMMMVSASQVITVADVIATLEDVAGAALPVVVDPTRVANAQVIESGQWPIPAGWEPRITLRAGLAETYANHLERRHTR